jgi:hypothetical protein
MKTDRAGFPDQRAGGQRPLEPPFEIEVKVGEAAGRCYLLDCMPNSIKEGSFKAHVVIFNSTGQVVMFMNPELAPFASAADAAEEAYKLGLAWLECHGEEDGPAPAH